MSFRGQLLKAGIDSNGKTVTIFENDGRLDITTSSTETSGTIRSANFAHTEGANSMSKITEVLRVSLSSEYYTGDWVNAIVGRIDYGDAGDARGGMAAAICAEMNMPAKSYASIGGPCYSLDCEFNCPTSFVAGDRAAYPIAFLKFGLWGGAKGQFDDEGYLFHLDGPAAGAGHLLSENSRTLRVNIGGTDKYIFIGDTEDTLDIERLTASETLSASDYIIGITTGDAAASGTVRAINVEHTVGANGAIYEAFRVAVGCEYTPGAWMNAIVGKIDLGTTGTGGGMSAAICAEMDLPAQSYTSYGAPLYSLDCEIGCPTGFVAGDRSDYPIAWINFAIWGNTTGQFDDECYLFHTDGLAAEANHLLSLTSQTLRVNIETNERFLVLSQLQDGLGLGNSTTDMALTASTKAVDIYTSHSANSGTVRAVNIEHTPGASGAILEAFRVAVTQEYNAGAWANAIVGKIDFGTTGTGGGMSAAICAEADLPAQDYASYGAPIYALDCEIGCPTGFVAGDRTTYPIGFMNFGVWGNTKAQFDQEGVLFHLDGVAKGAGSLFDDCTADVSTHALKININGTLYYIMLQSNVDA